MSHTMGVNYAVRFSYDYREWVRLGARSQDPLELQDAAHECEHGNLPMDRISHCACFGGVVA